MQLVRADKGKLPEGAKRIHVFVALCDNESQGIVPVGEKIGNGDDPEANLYWGCSDGLKSYFSRSSKWKLISNQSEINAQIHQVFQNLAAIAAAANSSLNDALKFTVYLTDLGHFASVNEVMAEYLSAPYPARAAVEVSALPRGALVEVDAILARSS